ncbi:MAG: sarcosine oxidase subunit gamma [Pseudomonadota bacterium]
MSDPLPQMIPLTALGGREARTDTHGPVTLTEVTNTAIASFAARRGAEAPAAKALSAVTALQLPGPGASARGGAFTVFWIGPDQWMVMAPHDTHELLAHDLTAAAPGQASVTEQNDAWCRFDLRGEGLIAVFERLCPINLRAAAPGHATRTSIDHLGCFVLMETQSQITVLGPRSSAGSLHHALLTAMRSAH